MLTKKKILTDHVFINFDDLDQTDIEGSLAAELQKVYVKYQKKYYEQYLYLVDFVSEFSQTAPQFYDITLKKRFSDFTKKERKDLVLRYTQDVAKTGGEKIFGIKATDEEQMYETLRSFYYQKLGELKTKVRNRGSIIDNAKVHLLASREDFFDKAKREVLEKICVEHIKKLPITSFIDDITLFTNPLGQSLNDPESYTFTKDEFNSLVDFEKTTGVRLRVKEGSLLGGNAVETKDKDFFTSSRVDQDPYPDLVDSSFSLSDIKKANEQIDQVVQIIKQNNFSPFEAMQYIHLYVSGNFGYKLGGEQNNIMGAYVTGNLVCTGYSSLTKAIIDRLGDERLQCESFSSYLYKNGEFEEAHTRNLIRIRDEKYKIDGYYFNDACWDSIRSAQDCASLGNFLTPIQDVQQDSKYELLSMRGLNRWNTYYRASSVYDPENKYVPKNREDPVLKASSDVAYRKAFFADAFKQELTQSQPIEIEKITAGLLEVLKKTEKGENVDAKAHRILGRSVWSARTSRGMQGAFPKLYFEKLYDRIPDDVEGEEYKKAVQDAFSTEEYEALKAAALGHGTKKTPLGKK